MEHLILNIPDNRKKTMTNQRSYGLLLYYGEDEPKFYLVQVHLEKSGSCASLNFSRVLNQT